MTTRPEERGSRMPSGPEEVHAAYGEPQRRSRGRPRQSLTEATIKSIIRSIAGRLGRALVRAVIGGGRRR